MQDEPERRTSFQHKMSLKGRICQTTQQSNQHDGRECLASGVEDDRRLGRSLSYFTGPRYLSSQLSDSFIISVRGTSCPVS
jgi:hypothetical protein